MLGYGRRIRFDSVLPAGIGWADGTDGCRRCDDAMPKRRPRLGDPQPRVDCRNSYLYRSHGSQFYYFHDHILKASRSAGRPSALIPLLALLACCCNSRRSDEVCRLPGAGEYMFPIVRLRLQVYCLPKQLSLCTSCSLHTLHYCVAIFSFYHHTTAPSPMGRAHFGRGYWQRLRSYFPMRQWELADLSYERHSTKSSMELVCSHGKKYDEASGDYLCYSANIATRGLDAGWTAARTFSGMAVAFGFVCMILVWCATCLVYPSKGWKMIALGFLFSSVSAMCTLSYFSSWACKDGCIFSIGAGFSLAASILFAICTVFCWKMPPPAKTEEED